MGGASTGMASLPQAPPGPGRSIPAPRPAPPAIARVRRRCRHLFVWIGVGILVVEIGAGMANALQRPRPYEIEILGSWSGFSMPSLPMTVLSTFLVSMAYALVPAGRSRTIAKWVIAGLLV